MKIEFETEIEIEIEMSRLGHINQKFTIYPALSWSVTFSACPPSGNCLIELENNLFLETFSFSTKN